MRTDCVTEAVSLAGIFGEVVVVPRVRGGGGVLDIVEDTP